MFQSPPTSHFSSHKTTILVDWIPENPLKSTKYYGWFPENTNDSRIAPGWIVWIPKNRCWNESDFTFRGGVPRVYCEFRWFIDLWEYTKNKRKNDRNLYTCCVYIYTYTIGYLKKENGKIHELRFWLRKRWSSRKYAQFWIDPFGWLSLDTNFRENEHLK